MNWLSQFPSIALFSIVIIIINKSGDKIILIRILEFAEENLSSKYKIASKCLV